MTPLYKFAQAYGRNSAYGRDTYTCGDNKECLAQYESSVSEPGTPNTGFIHEQPVLFYSGVVVFAAVLYTLTVLAIKKLRRNKTKA